MRLHASHADDRIDGVFGKSALAALRDRMQRSSSDPTAWPFWNDRDECEHVAPTGVWAVEPHLGAGGIGAKFEELLVVDEDGVYWLDDDLPNVRRWERVRSPPLQLFG